MASPSPLQLSSGRLGRVFGFIVMLEHCPATQFLDGGDHALLQLEIMFPSMKYNSPTPAALMQPQSMTFPPPCLTVGITHLSLHSSPGRRNTCLKPSEPNKLISSHHTIRHGSSNPCALLICFQQTVCGLSCVSSSEEASSWGDRHAHQFDVECDVWSEY